MVALSKATLEALSTKQLRAARYAILLLCWTALDPINSWAQTIGNRAVVRESAGVSTQPDEQTLVQVHVLATRSHPQVDELVGAVRQAVGEHLPFFSHDMNGQLRRGKEIVESVTDTAPGSVIWLAVGWPATQVVMQEEPGSPLIYALVAQAQQRSLRSKEGLYHLSTVLPVAEQIRALYRLFPTMAGLTILAGSEDQADLSAQLADADIAGKSPLRIVGIDSEAALPDVLLNLPSAKLGLMITANPSVINRYSLEYVVTETQQQRVPTLVYSEYLVKAGFVMAYLPSPELIGERALGLVNSVLKNWRIQALSQHKPERTILDSSLREASQHAQQAGDRGRLLVNSRALKRLQLQADPIVLATATIL